MTPDASRDTHSNNNGSTSGSVVCDPDRIEHSKVYDSLPVSLVVTDPHMDDNPIVYVNPAFTKLTGYSAEASCGRNCRFLQGPDTDRDTVERMAHAVAAREKIVVNLLNYKSDGTPFHNTLFIAPIVENGKILFFLGIQGEFESDDLDRTSQSLGIIHDQVHDHAASLLAIIRNSLGEKPSTDQVKSILAARLDALAQLYAGMYRTGSSEFPEEARLGAYLARVCSATHLTDKSYNTRLNTHFIECSADLRTAASIGLILSELLANAFGESNPYDSGASISVELGWKDGMACLSVSDDGNQKDGANIMPEEDSLGANIFKTLGRRIGMKVQHGDPKAGNDRTVRILFPTLKRAEREVT